MSSECEETRKAIEEISRVLEENRPVAVNLPLGVAYDMRSAVGPMLAIRRMRGQSGVDILGRLLEKLKEAVPSELVEHGREAYQGNLTIDVQLSLSCREVETVGLCLLSLPSGRQAIAALPIAPKHRATIDAIRNSYLQSFLIFYGSFVNASGKQNEALRQKVEEALS